MDKYIHITPAPQPWLHSLHRPRVNWAALLVWGACGAFWGTVYWLVCK